VTAGLELSGLRRAADARAAALAQRFGDALRVGDGAAAERVTDDALASGMAPEAVQSLVITPAMTRIGDLWEACAVGIADEHLATAISQRCLIRLFETMCARRVGPRSRERVMLAAVEGQRHVLGLRMVADVLEGAGFDVLYLGQDVPVDTLREFIVRHRPTVVGLGFGIASDVGALADALWNIHDVAPQARIMLGGRAIPPGLRDTGYPYVTNTTEVVKIVDTLLAGGSQRPPAMVEMLRSHSQSRTLPDPSVGVTDVIAESLAHAADDAGVIARVHIRRAEAYRELAYRDPLTDLGNRRAFEDELHACLQRPNAAGTLLMIDVDMFKTVNDKHGHDAGDRLLRATGQAISRSIRPGDMAARFGGDEFAVLLPGSTIATACLVGDRIRTAVSTATEQVTVSIGVAALSPDPRGALLCADTALYKAKAAGRDRVVAAGPMPSAAAEAS